MRTYSPPFTAVPLESADQRSAEYDHDVFTCSGPDGTRLAYHLIGDGDPLICLPGGPMRASEYLGDLGGLSAHHPLMKLDLRGTGHSAVPADPASYRATGSSTTSRRCASISGVARSTCSDTRPAPRSPCSTPRATLTGYADWR